MIYNQTKKFTLSLNAHQFIPQPNAYGKKHELKNSIF